MTEAYVKHEYPKYKYHHELDPVVVHSHDEHEALGEGWEDTPAAFADVEEIPGGVVDGAAQGGESKAPKAAKKGKK